jgi:FixJ family two-component response regulator
MNGIELQRKLADADCRTPIIFLTGRGNIPMSVQAMKAGAIDFLTKPVSEEKLLAAVRSALDKDRSDRLARGALADVKKRLETLTPREGQILRFVIGGLLNKQIATELGTAEKTIKVHRGRVMHKMGVRSVADLIRATMQAGIAPAQRSSKP